jgi:hypothetical protein
MAGCRRPQTSQVRASRSMAVLDLTRVPTRLPKLHATPARQMARLAAKTHMDIQERIAVQELDPRFGRLARVRRLRGAAAATQPHSCAATEGSGNRRSSAVVPPLRLIAHPNLVRIVAHLEPRACMGRGGPTMGPWGPTGAAWVALGAHMMSMGEYGQIGYATASTRVCSGTLSPGLRRAGADHSEDQHSDDEPDDADSFAQLSMRDS